MPWMSPVNVLAIMISEWNESLVAHNIMCFSCIPSCYVTRHRRRRCCSACRWSNCPHPDQYADCGSLGEVAEIQQKFIHATSQISSILLYVYILVLECRLYLSRQCYNYVLCGSLTWCIYLIRVCVCVILIVCAWLNTAMLYLHVLDSLREIPWMLGARLCIACTQM